MLYVMGWSIVRSYKNFGSQKWPVAEGIVLETSVKKREWPRSGVRYEPTIRYSYKVGEKQYCGAKISFWDDDFGDPESAARILGRFPEGSKVAVSFNPKCEAEAVLDPKFSAMQTITTVMVPLLGSVLFGWMTFLAIFNPNELMKMAPIR